jgi:hypothetical protein
LILIILVKRIVKDYYQIRLQNKNVTIEGLNISVSIGDSAGNDKIYKLVDTVSTIYINCVDIVTPTIKTTILDGFIQVMWDGTTGLFYLTRTMAAVDPFFPQYQDKIYTIDTTPVTLYVDEENKNFTINIVVGGINSKVNMSQTFKA